MSFSETDSLNLGQLFVVGFRGTQLSRQSWIHRVIQRFGLGGVILFDRNVDGSVQNFNSPTGLKSLVKDVRELFDDTPLISVDQEGGKVQRLKAVDGFLSTKSAANMAKEGLEETRRQTAQLANMLQEYGINFNFAPVVDLNINPLNPIIAQYERSFGAEAKDVIAFAGVVIEELHKKNIGSCLKHFPGHGSSGQDSHLGFVDISNTWKKVELEPYSHFIAQGFCDGIMTAHVVNTVLDPSGYPATLSKEMVTGVLRKQLGFSGVVFSDDLQMAAITNNWTYKQAVQSAILAGVDMLIVGNNLDCQEDAVDKGVSAILELLEAGVIKKERIQRSLAAVEHLKKRLSGELPWKNNAPPIM